MNLKKLKTILEKNKTELYEKRKVKSLYVFGSVARKENTHLSDVDILVEFTSDVGLFEFVALKNFLESKLKVKIDLVTSDATLDWMKESIEKDAIRVA